MTTTGSGQKQAGNVVRDAKGRIAKGVSLNPGGRPKSAPEVTELARAHTSSGVKLLADIAHDKKQPAAARVQAITVLLDRGWGKPTQKQEIAVTADLAGTLEKLRRQPGEPALEPEE